jgi:YVTN family beta-propeller protein
VDFGIYSLLSIIALFILVLSSPISIWDGYFKSAQAHSITVPIRGIGPTGITYNVANNNMYIANLFSSTVSVISGSTDSVIASILVGRNPNSIAYVPSNKLYVTNALSNDVTVINGATNKVVNNIPVGIAPVGIAYNPSNNNVYAVNNIIGTISVIDSSIDSVIDTIPLDSVLSPPSTVGPFSLAYDRINGGMYVGALGPPQVSVINTASNADVKDLPMPSPASDSMVTGVAYNPNYITAFNSNMVLVINPETNDFEGSPIRVGVNPIGIAYNPRNNNIYVANSGSNSVSVINPATNSVIDTITTGTSPVGIAHNPGNNHIYVTNRGSNTVSIIHP